MFQLAQGYTLIIRPSPMDSPWAILAMTVPLVLFSIFKIINHYKPKAKSPPGPRPWPIIGNLNLIIGTIPHQSLHKLSKVHGPIMKLEFGSSSVIVASSPDMAKQFLKIHDHVFASRPATAAGKYTSYNYSDMTWAPYGPHWRLARRIYANEIFNTRSLDALENLRVVERQAFISRLYSQSGKPLVLKDHLSHYSLSNISRMVLGNMYFDIDHSSNIMTFKEFYGMLDEWFLLSGAFNIGDWIPWLDFLDLQGYVKRMKALKKKLDRFFNHVINDHKARALLGRSFEKDIVDVLLQHSEDSNLQEARLTDDGVKGLMQNLLAGGADTSATTVEWAIHEILKQQHIIEKVREELDRVIGREKWVEEKDVDELPYIDAILKETLRLHPLATLLAPHFSIADSIVDGYHIPKGTMVLINTWSIGRDPNYWDEPEKFCPERFLKQEKKNIDVNGQNFELLPFGSGRRKCPGKTLALKIIRSTLANLLHGFHLKLPSDVQPENICMEECYGLTTHPKEPLTVILEPRLPCYLYN